MLKIETLETTPERTTIRLTGALTNEHLPELARQLDRARAARLVVRLDLSGLVSADRDAVEFFCSRRGSELTLSDPPSWVASWCAAEKKQRKARGAALVLAFAAVLAFPPSARAQEAQAPLTLSLRDAVRLAVTQGTAVPAAGTRIEQARTRVVEARSAFGPQVAAELVYQNNVLNLEVYGLPLANPIVGPFDVYDAHVKAALNVLDLAARRRVDAAESGVLAAEVDRLRTGNEVAAAVATLYVALQKAQASVDVHVANLELFGKLAELAGDQRRAGVADRLDTARAGVRVSRERQALLGAENQRDALRVALLRALGEDQTRPLNLTEPLADGGPEMPPAAEAVAEARRERPEIRLLDERLRGEGMRLRAEEADRLPTFGVGIQAGYDGTTPSHMLFNRQIQGMVSVPVLTGGRTAAREAEARARIDELKLQREEAARQVEEEARRALLSLASARSRVEVAGESLRLAEEELEVARDRYANGVSPSIDVDNAAAALEGARSDRIAALADAAQARIDLLRATGGIRGLIPTEPGTR